MGAPRFYDDHAPASEIVRRSGGVANGVQTGYADALKGVPCPRDVSLNGGKIEDQGEIARPAPSIGQQYGQGGR